MAARNLMTFTPTRHYDRHVVDITMQATWIREQDPERISVGLNERFSKNFADDAFVPRRGAR